MKILITGAGGVIGRPLVGLLKQQHHVISMDVHGSDRATSIDLQDRDSFLSLLESSSPDLVIHLAAKTEILYCETHQEESYAINYLATETLVDYCRKFKSRLIYFSTDYVFGNSDHAWSEDAPTCPSTRYARDKADSERLIIESLSDYAIIRTAQIYGVQDDFVSLVLKSILQDQPFAAYSNLTNCPTFILDLLEMVLKIVDSSATGFFHCVGPTALSRYEFALEIADAFQLDSSLIHPEPIDFDSDIRPSVVCLNSEKTYRTLDYIPGTLLNNLQAHKHLYFPRT